jgi:hypothetical protein
MRTSIQISIDSKLKSRLFVFKNYTGIPISKVITDALMEYLPEKEIQHQVPINMELEE